MVDGALLLGYVRLQLLPPLRYSLLRCFFGLICVFFRHFFVFSRGVGFSSNSMIFDVEAPFSTRNRSTSVFLVVEWV